MLGIMTLQQMEMYEKFAPVILCMDSTHKTNIYSFKLITLLVPDEFRNGYPVAFCISNKEDYASFIEIYNNANGAPSEEERKVEITTQKI